jgi:hypothetical protein
MHCCIARERFADTEPRFLADKYKLDMSSAANVNNLSSAIKRGSEKGDLVLPKGIGGRVKLPAKVCRRRIILVRDTCPDL